MIKYNLSIFLLEMRVYEFECGEYLDIYKIHVRIQTLGPHGHRLRYDDFFKIANMVMSRIVF